MKKLLLLAACGLIVVAVFMSGWVLGGGSSSEAQISSPHFQCYTILGTDDPPHFVGLVDQFGSRTADVDPATLLCAPVQKQVLNSQQVFPFTGDHLKCYPIEPEVQVGQNKSVTLRNQFGIETPVQVNFGDVKLLCVPTEKVEAQGELHYKCYRIPPHDPQKTVSLHTQFGAEDDVKVLPSELLCAPALKNGQGDLTAPHLKCYGIEGHDPNAVVELRDQFGVEEEVEVGRAELLCMPVSKQRSDIPPTDGLPAPPSTPHYKCYRIPPHDPQRTVNLQTQFGVEQNVRVERSERLCAPAKKLVAGKVEGDLRAPHLKCYRIEGHVPNAVVDLRDQFGLELGVTVGRAVLLCQQVEKTCDDDFELNISTGTLGLNNVDPNWRLIAAPAGTPPNAFGITRHPLWVDPATGPFPIPPANWISFTTGFAPSGPPGTYVYQITFPNLNIYQNPQLTFEFASDDVSQVLFNNVSLTTTQTAAQPFQVWSAPVPNPITAGFSTTNINTLTFRVNNIPGGDSPTGLIVEGRVTADCN